MADKTKAEVHGVDELFRDTEKLAGRIADVTPEQFERIAQLAVATVRAKVPKRTGQFASTVRASKTKRAVLVRMGKAKVPYAGWLEFGGTRGRPYVPGGRWLYPTAFDMEPQLVAIANRTAHDEIRSTHWKETG